MNGKEWIFVIRSIHPQTLKLPNLIHARSSKLIDKDNP